MGVTLWDVAERGKCWGAQLAQNEEYLFRAVAWAPDGKVLASSTEDPEAITFWKLNRALKPVASWNEWELPAPSPSLAFSPDGRTLAAASDNEVILFDATGNASRVGVLGGQGEFVWQVAYHPSGKMLATASEDGTVRFWDAASGKQRACYDWGIGKVCALAFAPDGMTCAAGGDTGRVVHWDVDD
jgi:WD40 repeat protein